MSTTDLACTDEAATEPEVIEPPKPVCPDGYFPIEPIEALALAKFRETSEAEWSDHKFAQMVAVEPRTIGRWREKGGLSWGSADPAAIKLGFHPVIVWPERWRALDHKVVIGTCTAKVAKEISEALDVIGRCMAARAREHVGTVTIGGEYPAEMFRHPEELGPFAELGDLFALPA